MEQQRHYELIEFLPSFRFLFVFCFVLGTGEAKEDTGYGQGHK